MTLWLTDLADACRTSGLDVVEVPGWRTRGHGPMQAVRSVICHHTAGPKTGDAPSLGIVRDGRPDLPGPLAQLVLARSGVVHVVAAGLSYHAGVVHDPNVQDNAHAIGIEAEATGVDQWPAFQWNAYARLCAALCRHYGLGVYRVLAHKEVAKPTGRKADPNFSMDQFRAAVAAALNPKENPMADLTDAEKATLLEGARSVLFGAEGVRPAGPVALSVHNLGEALQRVEDKLDTIGAGGVDVDELAEKVVDVLAARLAAAPPAD